MNHPIEKLMKLELITLILVLIVATAAVVKGFFLLIILSLYGIAVSMLLNGMAAMSTHHPIIAIKQFIRAIMLIVLATLIIAMW